MSDEHINLLGDTSQRQRLFGEALILSLRGAAIGAAIFFGIGIFFWLIAVVGSLLPPESKEALDPTPWSYIIEQPLDDTTRSA